MMYGEGDPLILLILAVGYGLWTGGSRLRQRVREWRAPDPVERLHDRYTAGEIDEEELERRLSLEMDPRNERIREHVEEVGGVGPVTAREVALSFESVDALREADREQLLSVPNVGPERAAEIADRF